MCVCVYVYVCVFIRKCEMAAVERSITARNKESFQWKPSMLFSRASAIIAQWINSTIGKHSKSFSFVSMQSPTPLP